jgi:hypothetical protein
MFSFLDDIETRINHLDLAVSQEDNLKPLKVSDLQMMSNGKISFRLSKMALTSVSGMLYQPAPEEALL